MDNPDTGGISFWPDAENYIRRGVTTIIGGPDFGPEYALSKLLEDFEAAPAAVNFGVSVNQEAVLQLQTHEWEQGAQGFSEAILERTRVPAKRLHLDQRGKIERGAFADIVVLNLEEILETGPFADLEQLSNGVRHVFVNGRPVLLEGEMTDDRPGRLLEPDSKR